MSKKKGKEKKRGPKGGIKHQPGRGHDRKSRPTKTERFKRRAKTKRQQREEEARRQWAEWDRLNDEQKKFLTGLKPKLPRPKNEN
jgi:hypothetical protein